MTPDAVLQKLTAKSGSESPEEGKKKKEDMVAVYDILRDNMAQKWLFFFLPGCVTLDPSLECPGVFFYIKKKKRVAPPLGLAAVWAGFDGMCLRKALWGTRGGGWHHHHF